ncbi:hypothetical protein GTP44_04710 [Duganella sp. FT50W]|uniref:Uncharacterized protein n=1 Tax=Duganella lactea TaxID=2692173 RepID=A0A6L8MEE3_9BURK|nr:hypothetical protein [Duganella lactea]MYM34008.1 hypothetical protein [Duganella lactea]MYM81260.1 hypothetical protein [Duganella lactea]
MLFLAVPTLIELAVSAIVTTVAAKAASDVYDSVVRDDQSQNNSDKE